MKNYGNGPSTGQIHTGPRRINPGFTAKDMQVSKEDRKILRPLAEQAAALASSLEMETRGNFGTK